MPERDYHLAEANRRIAETKEHIARQRETIAMLRTEDRPAAQDQGSFFRCQTAPWKLSFPKIPTGLGVASSGRIIA